MARLASGGSKTAAATSGPAMDPTPASSTPAVNLYPNRSRALRSNHRGTGVARAEAMDGTGDGRSTLVTFWELQIQTFENDLEEAKMAQAMEGTLQNTL